LESLHISSKTFDELAVLQDSTLSSRIHNIRHMIDQSRRLHRDVLTRDLEIEMCYAERELQIRVLRQELHEAYSRR